MSDFSPANKLEQMLAAAHDGELSHDELVLGLLTGTIIVLLDQEPDAAGQLGDAQPLVCEMANGHHGVAVFTSAVRSPERVGGFRFAVQTSCVSLVGAIADGIGLVVNPGSDYCFELPPAGVAQMLAMVTKESD